MKEYNITIPELPKSDKPLLPRLIILGTPKSEIEVVVDRKMNKERMMKMENLDKDSFREILRQELKELIKKLKESETVYIPVTIGGTTIDNIVISAQRQNFRSGGR